MNNIKKINRIALYFTLMLSLVFAVACSSTVERPQPDDDASACYVIYDAGSSATRLYIYQETEAGWIKHTGPETDALSDPVRRNRGKSMSDVNVVIADMLISLDDIRRNGPPDKNGNPQWSAFDWQTRCDTRGTAVYASAGMRLAERLYPKNSALLWKKLNKRLAKKMGMSVSTRTITEYEEGLYAWLALRELQADGNFGVAEMGGVSLQVTFPCPSCEDARQVRVKDQIVPVFSHSFLGWGQDEAWKRSINKPACGWGAGLKISNWQVVDCEAGKSEFADAAAAVTSRIKDSKGFRWYLTSAFRYMQDTDIDNFCRKGISGFEPDSSCFRAIYLQNALSVLAIPAESEPSDANWTLGAVVCTSTRCLDIQ